MFSLVAKKYTENCNSRTGIKIDGDIMNNLTSVADTLQLNESEDQRVMEELNTQRLEV